MARRFRKLRAVIRQLIVRDDVFGLIRKRPGLVLHIEPREWQFRSDAQKIAAFRAWLKEQVDAGILTTDANARPWLASYIESAYKKGKLRSYQEVYKGQLLETPFGLTGMFGKFPSLALGFAGTPSVAELESL